MNSSLDNEKSRLKDAYLEVRGKAVHDLSLALAVTASLGAQLLPRKIKLSRQTIKPQLGGSALRFNIKSVPKQKIKMIKFSGDCLNPMEGTRVPPPADAPRPPHGWIDVWYESEPVRQPIGKLKNYFTARELAILDQHDSLLERRSGKGKKKSFPGGLSVLYKRPIQPEFVIEDDEEDSVEDIQQMEAWLAHAKKQEEGVRGAKL